MGARAFLGAGISHSHWIDIVCIGSSLCDYKLAMFAYRQQDRLRLTSWQASAPWPAILSRKRQADGGDVTVSLAVSFCNDENLGADD
jgi:hypothetical protein